MSDADVRLVIENTGLSEGDARVLIGLVLAYHKVGSLRAERDQALADLEAMSDMMDRDLDVLRDDLRIANARGDDWRAKYNADTVVIAGLRADLEAAREALREILATCGERSGAEIVDIATVARAALGDSDAKGRHDTHESTIG